MQDSIKIKTALISVSNKDGLLELVEALHSFKVEILSTGGTFKYLEQAGYPVTEVSDYTSFNEIMDGRVKTLHPKIHGGLLGRDELDTEVMQQQDMKKIDMLVVNLYPFIKTISKPNVTLQTAIENIDIGGPAMLRSASKNHARVSVVSDVNDYKAIITELKENKGSISLKTRQELAVKTYSQTSNYDLAISTYLNQQYAQEVAANTHARENQAMQYFPEILNLNFIKKSNLRYGENPHQSSALYLDNQENIQASVTSSIQLSGKEISFNNLNDAEVAFELVKCFTAPSCVIVKHANPCGVASDKEQIQAYKKAFSCDKTSAFGGIIAFNTEVLHGTLSHILENQFVEVIIAPKFAKGYADLMLKKKNVRLLETGLLENSNQIQFDYKKLNGGLLVQTVDNKTTNENGLTTVTKNQPNAKQIEDLLFCWQVAKFVKSNAIVYAADKMTLGIGAGQMSRIYSARIAAIKASDEGLDLQNSVMASDAFFPFPDSVEEAVKVGVKAIIQPGGSINDDKVIAAADKAGLVMCFTGVRHFKH